MNPARFVFAGTMLQIENGIACFDLHVLVWRQIDQRMPPAASDLRVVPNLANPATRHILNGFERIRISSVNVGHRQSPAKW